jgi:bifunctional DNase/RNase
MIEVRVEGLLLDDANNSPVVLLREIDGLRVLPIFVGALEASAIAYAVEKATFARPLTLDLMRLLVEGLNGVIRRVVVTRIENDVYYAEVVLESGGQVTAVDARPSDSIGLALRAGAPIFVADGVMDAAGQLVSTDDEERLRELRQRTRSLKPEDFGSYEV